MYSVSGTLRSIGYAIVILLAAASNAELSPISGASVAIGAELTEPKDIRLVQSFRVEPDVEFLAWSADEDKIATGGQLGRELQVWNWRDGKMLARLKKPGFGGNAIWFDKERVVISPLKRDSSSALDLWDFRSGTIENVPMPAPPLIDEMGIFVASASRTRLSLLHTPSRVVIFDTGTWSPVGDISGLSAAAIAMWCRSRRYELRRDS
jgi:hypothetical protein